MAEGKIIFKVAIIGGGPKGIYAFERLAAWLKVHPPTEKTEIHIINRSDSFGAGENYKTDQPSWLLMNNTVGEINMWGEEKPLPVVPAPLSLSEWLCHIADLNVSDYDYTARAMAGRYLSHGFKLIASNLPENVVGKYIVGEVVDIYNGSGRYTLCLNANGHENYRLADRFDHILIATGHPNHRETEESLNFQSFADKHENAGYISSIYPVNTTFLELPPKCSVGVKGLGLTFVDAVLALTEGKGGRFVRDKKSEKLIYIPSGNEPTVIYPFCRSGLPMIPRRSVPNEKNELKFFTRAALEKYEPGKKLNFKKQIWPLLKQDLIYAYYDIAMKNVGNTKGLSGCDNFEEVEHLVAEYHINNPYGIRFDVERFLEPLQEKKFHETISHNQFIKSLYNYYLQEARKGELRSPLAAAAAVWSKASSLFCELYAFGGLTPQSHKCFDSSIRGKLNRVAFGPPVKSAEKLYALIESEILNFEAARNPNLILDEKSGSFMLESGPYNTRYPVQYLVDARIPQVSLADNPGPLFRNMLNRGLITQYENKFGTESYRPGAVNITRQGFAIDKNSGINWGIAVTGTPTEGITFDNDTLSRSRNNFVDSWAEFISMEYSKFTLEVHAM